MVRAKINLLPWREARRERRKKEFVARCVLSGLLGVVAVFGGYMYFSQQLSEQQSVNEMITAENAKLDQQLKSFEGLQTRRQQILDRMKLIDDLQGQRPVIVHVVDEIVRLIPRDMYLTKFKRVGNKFTIEGEAKDPDVVAKFLRSLETSPWFRNAFMDSFTAPNERATQVVKDFVNKSNQAAGGQLNVEGVSVTSLVEAPESSYGKFVVTVDLGSPEVAPATDANSTTAETPAVTTGTTPVTPADTPAPTATGTPTPATSTTSGTPTPVNNQGAKK